jgi:hypothetical protein
MAYSQLNEKLLPVRMRVAVVFCFVFFPMLSKQQGYINILFVFHFDCHLVSWSLRNICALCLRGPNYAESFGIILKPP